MNKFSSAKKLFAAFSVFILNILFSHFYFTKEKEIHFWNKLGFGGKNGCLLNLLIFFNFLKHKKKSKMIFCLQSNKNNLFDQVLENK